MNVLINTLKEEVSDPSKLVLIYLFNHWLKNNQYEEVYFNALLPTALDIAKNTGVDNNRVKSVYLQELIDKGLLNVEGKYYTISLHDINGDLVELTDPAAFDGKSKCSASWNMFGNYINIDNETFKTKELRPAVKITYIIVKYVWLKPDGEQFYDVSYYSNFERRGFTIDRRNIKTLQEKGYLEMDRTNCQNFKGFSNIKLHTIMNKAERIKKMVEATLHSDEEMLKLIEEKDGIEEIKEIIKEKTEKNKKTLKSIKENAEDIFANAREYEMPDYDFEKIAREIYSKYKCNDVVLFNRIKHIVGREYNGKITDVIQKKCDREYSKIVLD